MSEVTYNPLISGIEEIRGTWGWFLFLGILFIVLGVACIAFDVTATFATVYVFGWMLLIAGVVELVHALRTHTWSGFFLYLLSALLRGFTGYLLVQHTFTGAEALTLILASFLVVLGLFRAIGAGMAKFPRWGLVRTGRSYFRDFGNQRRELHSRRRRRRGGVRRGRPRSGHGHRGVAAGGAQNSVDNRIEHSGIRHDAEI